MLADHNSLSAFGRLPYVLCRLIGAPISIETREVNIKIFGCYVKNKSRHLVKIKSRRAVEIKADTPRIYPSPYRQ